MCAQELLNYLPCPTLVVLAGAHGLLNHPAETTCGSVEEN
jgi:hypothetical protein